MADPPPAEALASLLVDADPVEDAEEESMTLYCSGDLWAGDNAYQGLSCPKKNAFSYQVGGQDITLRQDPPSLLTTGETGGVVWDGGVVLAKALEHWQDTGMFTLRARQGKVVDLGAGVGVVGCATAALGAHTVITDQWSVPPAAACPAAPPLPAISSPVQRCDPSR